MNRTILTMGCVALTGVIWLCNYELHEKITAEKKVAQLESELKEKTRDIEILEFNYNEDIKTLLQGRKDVSLYVTTTYKGDYYVICASIDTTIDCQFAIGTHKEKVIAEFEASEIKKELNLTGE